MKKIDEVWLEYNWQRIPEVIHLKMDLQSQPLPTVTRAVFVDELDLISERHSARGFDNSHIDSVTLMRIFEQMREVLGQLRGYEILLIEHDYEIGVGERIIVSKGNELSSEENKNNICLKQLKDCIQNQWWFSGGGISVVICVDWAEMATSMPGNQGPLNALIGAGKIGQHIIHFASNFGLAARMTPAISDSKMKSLVAFDIKHHPIYYLRIGKESTKKPKGFISGFET